MKRAILKNNQDEYFFVDDPELEDIDLNNTVTVLELESTVGSHLCHYSQVYGEPAIEHDSLQLEPYLPDGIYIVCYYWYPGPEDGADLYQLVDWHISKEELINNVVEHKYVEGADYYLVSEEKGDGVCVNLYR